MSDKEKMDETTFVLNNKSLMRQINESLDTHLARNSITLDKTLVDTLSGPEAVRAKLKSATNFQY